MTIIYFFIILLLLDRTFILMVTDRHVWPKRMDKNIYYLNKIQHTQDPWIFWCVLIVAQIPNTASLLKKGKIYISNNFFIRRWGEYKKEAGERGIGRESGEGWGDHHSMQLLLRSLEFFSYRFKCYFKSRLKKEPLVTSFLWKKTRK